jgi:hypothetical protein
MMQTTDCENLKQFCEIALYYFLFTSGDSNMISCINNDNWEKMIMPRRRKMINT